MRESPVLAIFALGVSLCFAACGEPEPRECDLTFGKPGGVVFAVYNLNMRTKDVGDESVAGFARRVGNIADKLLEDIVPGDKRFEIIGLNEGFSRRDEGTLNWAPVYELHEIPCEITGTNLNTAECLAAHLENSATGPRSIALQKGEIGIIANQTKFALADDEVRYSEVGDSWFGTVQRQVLGARLNLSGTEYVLPFYSTHISAKTSGKNRADQLEELVREIKQWWKPGDLTPVLVGDFNSQDFDQGDWAILQRDFCEVGRAYGEDPIEHVWIGRKTSFVSASGELRPVRYETIDIDDGGKNMSDHPARYTELSIVPLPH